MAYNWSRKISLNETMKEIHLNKIINCSLFDYILFVYIFLYSITGDVSHEKKRTPNLKFSLMCSVYCAPQFSTARQCTLHITLNYTSGLVNNQLDAQLLCFIICLLQSSTCFEQRRAHHQEVKFY